MVISDVLYFILIVIFLTTNYFFIDNLQINSPNVRYKPDIDSKNYTVYVLDLLVNYA